MFYSILIGPPYDLRIEDGEDGARIIVVPLARGNDENRIVSVVCELARMVINDVEYWEFSFSIEVFGLDGSIEAFRTQERAIAAPYIPDEMRPSVMTVVCAALERLVEHVNPARLYWVTKDREPHEKALHKYHMIRETLENAGFLLRDEGIDQFFRRFWTMVR
jgi:hypothetical protein